MMFGGSEVSVRVSMIETAFNFGCKNSPTLILTPRGLRSTGNGMVKM
jgi:hypothetical protein